MPQRKNAEHQRITALKSDKDWDLSGPNDGKMLVLAASCMDP